MKQKEMPKNGEEAVSRVLAHIERQAGRADTEAAYAGLFLLPELPMDALAALGTLTEVDEPGQSGAIPSLLLETGSGQAQVEICPFGPLALISSDGQADTDPLAQALVDSGIYPLFPSDLDQAGAWHGAPLGKWLFPRRLSGSLALFDALWKAPRRTVDGAGGGC